MSKTPTTPSDASPERGQRPPAPTFDNRAILTDAVLLALLANPRYEQIARLPAADPTRHGAGLHNYASRLVDGYLAAQEAAT